MDDGVYPVVMIMVSLITLSVRAGEDDTYLTCINCAGDVGDSYTNCGESVEPGVELDTINCTGFCMKQVQYFIDQKISVTRNCTEECAEGCTMVLGTSTCVHCCQEDNCNGAVTLWPTIPILLNTGYIAAMVLTV